MEFEKIRQNNKSNLLPFNSNDLVCGLYYIATLNEDVPVFLKNVTVKISIVDFVAKVSVAQTYINKEERRIHAKFVMPFEMSAFLVDLKCYTETTHVKVKTHIRQKEENSTADEIWNEAEKVLRG